MRKIRNFLCFFIYSFHLNCPTTEKQITDRQVLLGVTQKVSNNSKPFKLLLKEQTNGYLLDFYWKLGRDIEAKQYTNTYGSGFYKNLSQDLKNEMPGVKGFSPINLRYMSKFFKLYAPLYRNIPQTAELFSDSLSDSIVPQVAEQFEKRQQPVDDFNLLFSIPWDHHRRIIDKCKDDMDKALFFVRKTWENN